MAVAQEKRLQHINIHLIKAGITDIKVILANGKSAAELKAKRTVLPDGVLYYESPRPKNASWRDFLAPGFGQRLPMFTTQHASAVLLFPVGNGNRKRLFAVTFGYGRALLSESALEPDFGLRTALHLCNPETLRAINYRTIEERTRIGRVQLSDAGSVDAFRMNFDTDLLRGLEAESNDRTVCERLGARWSNLIVSSRVEVDDLPSLASRLLSRYRNRSLPAEYAWIENVRRVTDPMLITTLDTELEERVNRRELDGIRLAIPEIAGSTVGVNVKLFKPDVNSADFTSDFDAYLGMRKRKGNWTIETAKNSHTVYLVDSSTCREVEHSSIYRCIVAEFDHAHERYLLVDGEWFQLNRDFVQAVNESMSAIPVLSHSLPNWNSGESEGDWNARACKSWKEAALLDKTNIPHGGGRSRIEPADIVTRAQVLAHVKRRDMSSSGLSHLFAQGVVASQLIYEDKEYRRKVAKCLPRSHKPVAATLSDDKFDPRLWTVGYVLLGADSVRPAQTMPFFSKVNLKGASQRLKLMGYKVGIIGV